MKQTVKRKALVLGGVTMAGLMASAIALADGSGVTTFSAMASTITGQFEGIAKLVTAGAYISGIGFSLGAIMKFKQHKDNPTQIPIGTPIALTFIAATLLFFPTVLGMTGKSVFGTTTTAGATGTAWGGSGGGS